MKQLLKRLICDTLVLSGIDRWGRYRNRHKTLIVMYHGVASNSYDDPIWTQLPTAVFQGQLRFFKNRYRPVSLSQFIQAIKGGKPLPERSVLITFDDGLKNNYTIAFPILQSLNMPAAIFLTTGFIGTGKYLWADELYVLVKKAVSRGIELPSAFSSFSAGKQMSAWETYVAGIERLKRLPDGERQGIMDSLRVAIPHENDAYQNDFSLLDWEEVRTMARSGLIDFGVHTATHKILSKIEPEDEESEIIQPKASLEEQIKKKTESFCYPNGRSGLDFSDRHKEILKRSGYACAFSTDHGLQEAGGDPYAIKRIPAGNDMTSYPSFFKLACAGIFQK